MRKKEAMFDKNISLLTSCCLRNCIAIIDRIPNVNKHQTTTSKLPLLKSLCGAEYFISKQKNPVSVGLRIYSNITVKLNITNIPTKLNVSMFDFNAQKITKNPPKPKMFSKTLTFCCSVASYCFVYFSV